MKIIVDVIVPLLLSSLYTRSLLFPLHVSLSPYLHFNGHFPGGTELAGTRMSPF